MRKLITAVAFLFLSAFAFGQTTAVVTGNLVDQSETGTSSGISVDVTLVNTGSQRCFVNGTGTVVTEKKNYTAAQILAGITLAKTANITCGSTSGQTRWRFTFKNSALNTARDCDLQISGATSLNTATCLQATTTPTTTVPTSSLFLLLDGSNYMTGNLVPAVNGTQSIGTSGSRWSVFASAMDNSGNATVGGTLGVTGASTLGAMSATTGGIAKLSVDSSLNVHHYTLIDTIHNPNTTFPEGNDGGFAVYGPADNYHKSCALEVTSTTSVGAPGMVTVTVGSPTECGSALAGNATAQFTIPASGAGLLVCGTTSCDPSEDSTAESVTSANFSIVSGTQLSILFAKTHTQPYKIRQHGSLVAQGRLTIFKQDPTSGYLFHHYADGTQLNDLMRWPVNSAASWPNGAPQIVAVFTGANGANSDIAWRMNNSSSVFKILNAANNATPWQVDNSGNTTTLGNANTTGQVLMNGSGTITVAPPSGASNTGWKYCLFSTVFCAGIANSTEAHLLNTGWISTFTNGTFPANDGTASKPDSNSRSSIGDNGSLALKEVAAPTAAGAGFGQIYCDSTAHDCQSNYNNGGFKHIPQLIGSGTASMTTVLIAAGACGTTVTVAATGVLTTDVINEDFNAAVTAANNGLLIFHKWPTAGNVNFNYCNPGAAGVTPTAMTVNWNVVR